MSVGVIRTRRERGGGGGGGRLQGRYEPLLIAAGRQSKTIRALGARPLPQRFYRVTLRIPKPFANGMSCCGHIIVDCPWHWRDISDVTAHDDHLDFELLQATVEIARALDAELVVVCLGDAPPH